ncbi:hypothetical protein CLV85_0939 [Salinibacterium amurskyense]|uniref:Uncharacterized protein n=1 Tax=Salinibacterium amurskyense TaxID=205941 RepID=A0A2M9D7Y9_9MICO|nr:hypothetical protein [Salinibacterium amurskyense]PJJ81758.1 hypothetical protein CLV85_0939 [Salinibacterium amurskyense]RLQ83732.1 hypothetical protein D9C83_04655 [Salinibacterium amurskyense]GHD79378.1 hypothetical protein GCM10007394_08790 [Salinibacterium amurskyense]
MFSLGLPLLVATDAADVVRGTTIAVVTVVVLVLAVGAVAFVALFRRGGDRGIRGTASQSTLESRAAGLLVALDDRVREADLELGFAVAQFGAETARDFANALAEARDQLTEAFRLGQQRDEAPSTADQRRRSLTLQMTALCEKALASLDNFDASFAARRHNEAAAAATEQQLRSEVESLRERLATAARQLETAEHDYADEALTVARRELAAGQTELAAAATALDAAAPSISPTGVNAVTDTLRTAANSLHRAQRAAAATDQALAELAEADAAVLQLRDATRTDLHEARFAAESAPDPQSGARILTAISANERALELTAAESDTRHSPLEQLELLNDAGAELDSALATARNQQQRFEHARAAYQGTLVAARSQISVVRELVGRGGASARARTRLAEAERQLMIAEAETDPVEALDAIRRSVTHARDADALARY